MIPRSPTTPPRLVRGTEPETPDPAFAPPPTTIKVLDVDFEFVFSGKLQVTLEEADTFSETDKTIVIVKNGEELTVYKHNLLTFSKRKRDMVVPAGPFVPPMLGEQPKVGE